MKKTLAMLLALTMLLALCACGAKTEAPAAAPAETPAEAPAETPAEAPATVDFPKGNITIIVGYNAGGDTDLAARIVGDALAKELGVNVVVENLAGGSGVVGRTEMLNREADGYTLVFDQFGSAITQVLMGNTTYDLEGAGTPVAGVGVSALALAIASNNAQGIKTMEDFIEYAKTTNVMITTPGQWTFAHLVMLDAFNKIGIPGEGVPGGGTADAVTQALGGHVDACIVPYAGVSAYLESGDLTLLGLSGETVFAPEGSPLLTDLGANEMHTWYGIWTNNGVDEAVVKILSDAIVKVLGQAEVSEGLAKLGIEINAQDYVEFGQTVVDYAPFMENALRAGGAIA